MTFSAGFGSPMATPTSVYSSHTFDKKENMYFLIHLSTKSILNPKSVMQFSGILPSPRPFGFLQVNHVMYECE